MSNEAPTQRNNSGVRTPNGRPPIPKFTMPSVYQGQAVLWFPDRYANADQSHVAYVTEVGERGITVAIFVPGAMQVLPKSGVRHAYDPEHELIDNIGSGVWDFLKAPVGPANQEISDLTSRVKILEEAAAMLQMRFEAAEKKLAAK